MAEDAVVLSFDEIRRELYPGESFDPKQNKATFTTLRIKLEEAMMARRNIVIDSINRSPSQRILYARWAKKRRYLAVCVFCQKHYSYAINANRMRDDGGKSFSDEVIKSLYRSFTPPENSEGWDEIHVIDGNKYSVEVEGQRPLKTGRRRKPTQ